jgi:hypothetical protein
MKQMQRENQVKLSQHDIEAWKENEITKLFFSKLDSHSEQHAYKILSATDFSEPTYIARTAGAYQALTGEISLILLEMISDK